MSSHLTSIVSWKISEYYSSLTQLCIFYEYDDGLFNICELRVTFPHTLSLIQI